MPSLNAIRNGYVDAFPSQVPIKLAQSLILTTTLHLMVGTAVKVALVFGAVAALSSLLEAMTRPLTQVIFPDNPMIARLIQVTIPKTAALSLAEVAAPWITSLATKSLLPSMIGATIAWISFNLNFYEDNVGIVDVL